MTKSDLFPTLNDITFAEKNADIIESEIISQYENLSGRTLARGDPIRLFLNSIALVIIQQRNLIDFAGKMNLLAYASGDYLDHLGALLGVTRLQPSPATVTVKFTLSEAQPAKILIPEGTRVSPGNNILFAVNTAGEIPAGELSCELKCTCTETGTIGNNYVIGQIKKLVDIFPFEMKCENIDESNGGTDLESDENFRERIQIAPESFSNAGSKGAYIYYARTANSNINDVAVIGPNDNANLCPPGHVIIYPLLTDGEIPNQEILDAVYNACNREDVRPDTDYLHVRAPEIINYNLELKYYIDKENSSTAGLIAQNVLNAINDWQKWQKVKIGRDINPSELNHRIIQAGAKRCEITSPNFRKLEQYQIAVANQVLISYGGLEEG
ncbi:MAG: baseplate J/gp47 family protein [Synergistaceae bacterium]|nr:baseplate J/gp47 family protein [Synergistaceae bacterium]